MHVLLLCIIIIIVIGVIPTFLNFLKLNLKLVHSITVVKVIVMNKTPCFSDFIQGKRCYTFRLPNGKDVCRKAWLKTQYLIDFVSIMRANC